MASIRTVVVVYDQSAFSLSLTMFDDKIQGIHVLKKTVAIGVRKTPAKVQALAIARTTSQNSIQI